MTETAHPAWAWISEPAAENTLASVDQLRKLQRVTDAALAHLTVDDLLDELLIRVRDALGADTAAILLLDKGRGELVARAAKGLEEEVEQGVRIPMGRGFAGTVAASGKAVSIYDVDHSMVLNPILRQKGVRSLLGVPLVVQGDTLGVLHVGTLTHRQFTPEDEALLQLVGDRVALAINAGLYERERVIAATLQRSFLPETLPALPGFSMAARYLAAPGGSVGGDWYDVFLLPEGTLAVAIGDVIGRGLGAASVMGKLRNALRAYALELSSPSEVLQRMNRLLQHLDPEQMATVLYGTIDPADLTFRFASAGHMAPIIREPDGSVRVTTVEGGPPIGAPSGWSFTDKVERLEPGTSVVLYTDGLVERRDASLDDGFRRLSELCQAELAPEELCDAIVEELTDDGHLDDDVAFLVIQAVPLGSNG